MRHPGAACPGSVQSGGRGPVRPSPRRRPGSSGLCFTMAKSPPILKHFSLWRTPFHHPALGGDSLSATPLLPPEGGGWGFWFESFFLLTVHRPLFTHRGAMRGVGYFSSAPESGYCSLLANEYLWSGFFLPRRGLISQPGVSLALRGTPPWV